RAYSEAVSASSIATRCGLSARRHGSVTSVNASPVIIRADARSHQRWTRCVLPQPLGPYITSVAKGQSGHWSTRSAAAMFLADRKKSDRANDGRRERSSGSWVIRVTLIPAAGQCEGIRRSRGLLRAREDPRPSYEVGQSRE